MQPPPPPEAVSPVISAPPSLLSTDVVDSARPLAPVDDEKEKQKPPAAAKKKPANSNTAGTSKNKRHDSAQDDRNGRPAYDRDVQRSQNVTSELSPPPSAPTPLAAADTSPPAAPQAAAAESRTPSGSGIAASPALPMDRLNIGKQSVGVSVDVIGPSSMYLNQEATLKIIVRNNGKSDAFNVAVTDELPAGLKFVSSQPEAKLLTSQPEDAAMGERLIWSIDLLPAGSDRLITLRVRPTKPGSFEHGATVKVLTGSKARLRVMEPKLKVDVTASPSVGKVLKGQAVQFKVSVTNTGDGPARNVAIQAKLTPGLRHESAPRTEEQMMYEITIPVIGAGKTETLDTLVADALIGGEQSCTVTAQSDDVVFRPEDARTTKTVMVVEPKLKLAISGPDSRYTDTIADYELAVENPGTAPARKVRVLATLPINGRLLNSSKTGGNFDPSTGRLEWMIDQIDPAPAQPQRFTFQVRMGGTGKYELLAEAKGQGGIKAQDRLHTEVVGMPDVDLVVSESKRVVDVGGQTTFVITLRNYGTKDASNLAVLAKLSANLKYKNAGGGKGQQVNIEVSKAGDQVAFDIPKLGAGKEMVLGVLVTVESGDSKQGNCNVSVKHDDLTEPFVDMATIRISSSGRTAAANRGSGPN
jgi:uncharacterized repeat protein (TIGR01451 family)